jgi:hypothetical protein
MLDLDLHLKIKWPLEPPLTARPSPQGSFYEALRPRFLETIVNFNRSNCEPRECGRAGRVAEVWGENNSGPTLALPDLA